MALRNYGGSWEKWEDELTIPRLEGMVEELKVELPLHIAVMAGLGVKPPESSLSDDTFKHEDAVAMMLGMSPGGFFDPNRVPKQ